MKRLLTMAACVALGAQTPTQPPPTTQATPAIALAVPTTPPAAPSPAESVTLSKVIMVEKEGQHDLTPIAGAFASSYAFITVLFYSDFPDTSAQLHIKDGLPTFYVMSEVDPRGRVFLVKAEKTKKGRSVKLGKSGFGSISGFSIPDPDWTFPFTFKKTDRDNVWEITPKVPLAKGEYGIFMGVLGNTGAPAPGGGGNLFDFAVD